MTDRQIWLTPDQVHTAEQRWAAAQEMLDVNLKQLQNDAPNVAEVTGIADASLLFDWMWASILKREMVNPDAHKFTQVMCAAAMVKLTQASNPPDPLAEYEPKKGTPNDSDT